MLTTISARDPKLIWASGDLIIENSCDSIERDLFYTEKSIVEGEAGNKVQRIKTPMFRVIQEDNPRTIVTFHGFFERVKRTCTAEGIRFTAEDRRESFPLPQLRLMKGFRSGQYAFLVEGLLKNRSGLFKAPTRWGKSICLVNTIRAFPGIKTVVAMPGVDLLGQQLSYLQSQFPDREVRGIFSGSKGKKQSEDITVVSFDSMEKVDYDSTKLLLIDEPHAAVSAERLVSMSKFKKARIYGYGATLEGRFDGRDDLIVGLVGPVLVEKTFREAVAEQAICNIVVYVVKVPFDDFVPYNRLMAYRHLLLKNWAVSKMAAFVCNEMIPADWQTVIFITEQKQADMVQHCIPGSTVAIAGRMQKAERDVMFSRMVSGDIKRCIATSIYAQGVTFPDIRCMINLSAGGGSITGVQKPGRLAQIRPGKKAGYVVDFVFACKGQESVGGGGMGDADGPVESPGPWRAWRMIEEDGKKRLKVYEELGYEIRYVESLDEIRFD